MDEQTFRRLSPDAVAGRLDPASYERWKAAAAEDPARAGFVVRVAEADARLSGIHGVIGSSTVTAPPPRVPRRTFLALAVGFAAVGLLAGGLVMHSYLKAQDRKAPAAGNDLRANLPSNKTPAHDPYPAQPGERANAPARNQPEPEPEPEPQPEPQPEPPPQGGGLRLVSAAETVSIRGVTDRVWRKLQPGEVIPDGSTVSHAGPARFSSSSTVIHAAAAMQFEIVEGVIRFVEGRACVRVTAEQTFTCYKQDWSLAQGAFIVEPKRLGGELFLLEGAATDDRAIFMAPRLLMLDGSVLQLALEPKLITQLERELIGPHRTLLNWDCESEAATPGLGEVVQPGALGDGRAVQRKQGQPGIGVSASTEVFKAEPGARFRLRVKSGAPALRLELRVSLDTGFRVVDAKVALSGWLAGNDTWQTIDVPMEILRAGRFRDEPGWLDGRSYSAMLLAAAVDPDNPLTRHELVVDDVLVYVPEK